MNTEVERRGPGRPPRREDLRENDSLARAEARVREIRGSGVDISDNRDRFAAPPPPDGWDYQWKRRTVYGMEDPAYQVEVQRQGWEPVPLSRHPEMMPHGWNGSTIELDGMTLMERPLVLTQEARRREREAAVGSVRAKEMQLGLAPSGQFAREARAQRLNKGYEPIPADEE